MLVALEIDGVVAAEAGGYVLAVVLQQRGDP